MSSITEDQQQRLLEHYAVGLREILAEHDDLTDPALTQKMRALRDDAPVDASPGDPIGRPVSPETPLGLPGSPAPVRPPRAPPSN